MADTPSTVTVKIIDRNNEPFTYNNVKKFTAGVCLSFVDENTGEEHFTNMEYHVTVTPKKS